MRILGRLARCVPLLVLANAVWFWRAEGSPAVKIIVLAAAGLLSLAVHVKPCRADREATWRLRLLRGGYMSYCTFTRSASRASACSGCGRSRPRCSGGGGTLPARC